MAIERLATDKAVSLEMYLFIPYRNNVKLAIQRLVTNKLFH